MKTIALLFACCAGLMAQGVDAVIQEAGRVVGKPYSATAVTHSVQTLANGAHLDQTATRLVWQDDQGRRRQEVTTEPRHIVIQDMVAAAVYVLEPDSKTAHKNKVPPQKIAGDVSPVDEARAAAGRNPNQTVEDLGSQIVNGVMALGVRITNTIPVGAIGNDQELKSVVERWYSNEIHAMVKTVSTDPRSGTHTLELTNIVRTTPDPALFQVPAGYTITTAQQ
jgi:hypothetical protein